MIYGARLANHAVSKFLYNSRDDHTDQRIVLDEKDCSLAHLRSSQVPLRKTQLSPKWARSLASHGTVLFAHSFPAANTRSCELRQRPGPLAPDHYRECGEATEGAERRLLLLLLVAKAPNLPS